MKLVFEIGKEMNHTKGYDIHKALRYQRKCRYCGCVADVPREIMNFSGPTFVRCACGHEVQMTDDLGFCPSDVTFIYDKEGSDG